jgi:hypothetical protein
MKVSQSLLRDYTGDEKCGLVCYYTHIKNWRKPPSNAMKLGLAFESIVLGCARGEEDYSNDYPKTKKRVLKSGVVREARPNADSQRMLDAAPRAKTIMQMLFQDWYQVQASWETDNMTGHPDLLSDFIDERTGDWYPFVIVDLKYVTAKTPDQSKFSYFNWSDIMSNDLRQSLQYVSMHYQKTGNVVPFVYAAFSGHGWRIVKMLDWTLEDVKNYISEVDENIAIIKENGFQKTVPDAQCEECWFKNRCDRKTKFI